MYPDGTITRNPRTDDNYIATKKAQVDRLKEKKSWIIIYNSNNIQLLGVIKF